jgi:hypothetical protein
MNKSGFLLLFLVILFSLSGLEVESPAAEGTAVKIKGKKEILVARDVGRGGGIYSLRWCGKRGLIYRLDNTSEVESIDFLSKERTKIVLNRYDTLLNCTPDGKRVLYLDEDSVRSDEEIEGPKTELVPGVFGWLGHTVDMYMYDIVTDKRALVASIRSETPYDALSPDGSKVLLGERHRLAVKAAAAQWEGIWFTKGWKPYEAAWFPDSSGVLTYGEKYSNIICVEFFGKDGWARCFDLALDTEAFKGDRGKRFYFLGKSPQSGKNNLHRCDIRDGEIFCERILEGYNVKPSFGFLPGGDIVFQDYDEYDECIRRVGQGRDNARCIIYPRYGDSVYDKVSLLGVSPDGRWLVFDRYNRITEPDGESFRWRVDLFVIDLAND